MERESERVNEMGMLVSLRELKMPKLPTATVTPIPVTLFNIINTYDIINIKKLSLE